MAGCEPILVEVQGNLAWPRLSRHYRWLRHAEPTCSSWPWGSEDLERARQIRTMERGHDERLTVGGVEPDRQVAGQFHVLVLVAADGDPVGAVQQHIGGHEAWVDSD